MRNRLLVMRPRTHIGMKINPICSKSDMRAFHFICDSVLTVSSHPRPSSQSCCINVCNFITTGVIYPAGSNNCATKDNICQNAKRFGGT